ncbi:hypothetical protein M6B38_171040 [Iris pallida]|uniref:PRKC apoptosis WT1 regulator protein n=1 Tax=Iris pallida TaxID=29817 RepID=A0AAX6EVB5_IRIPA|nr:hypothetical protein M6B38_171040 [Iris pallida]
MSSQSWNSIPEARRKALAMRQRQSTYDSDEDVDLDTIEEAIAKPHRGSRSDLHRKASKASSGSPGHGGGAKDKSPSNSFQEEDVDDDVDRKLQRLETRMEKLLTLNENLSERNQKLEDLLVKVAEKVGISHSLGKRSSPSRQ